MINDFGFFSFLGMRKCLFPHVFRLGGKNNYYSDSCMARISLSRFNTSFLLYLLRFEFLFLPEDVGMR